VLNLDALLILLVEGLDDGFDDLADFFFVCCCWFILCGVFAFVG
jgi:hypothetical protein